MAYLVAHYPQVPPELLIWSFRQTNSSPSTTRFHHHCINPTTVDALQVIYSHQIGLDDLAKSRQLNQRAVCKLMRRNAIVESDQTNPHAKNVRYQID